jgi:hypothetical protein
VSYTPKPGSTAQRAIAYLEKLPKGAEVMTSKIAEAINAPNDSIQPCMLPALSAGLVFARQKYEHPRAPYWYSLTDHRSIPRVKPPLVSIPGADDAAHEHTPQGANRDATGFEGRGQQWPDATDCKARGKVMSPEASASATGRGADGPIARGAAPVSSSDATIELHMVVRVTHAQAEAIVQLLGRSA